MLWVLMRRKPNIEAIDNNTFRILSPDAWSRSACSIFGTPSIMHNMHKFQPPTPPQPAPAIFVELQWCGNCSTSSPDYPRRLEPCLHHAVSGRPSRAMDLYHHLAMEKAGEMASGRLVTDPIGPRRLISGSSGSDASSLRDSGRVLLSLLRNHISLAWMTASVQSFLH